MSDCCEDHEFVSCAGAYDPVPPSGLLTKPTQARCNVCGSTVSPASVAGSKCDQSHCSGCGLARSSLPWIARVAASMRDS